MGDQDSLAAICRASFPESRSWRWKLWSPNDSVWYERIRELWEEQSKKIESIEKADGNPTIPLLIHQIWLGSAKRPEICDQFAETWRTRHPQWEYRLWTDKDAAVILQHHPGLLQAFEAASNPAEKSDILRLVIVLEQGGLYVDMDFECLRPLDELHHATSFYTGVSNVGAFELNNGLFAAAPRHPLVAFYCEHVGKPWPEWGQDDVEPGEAVAHQLQRSGMLGVELAKGKASFIADTGPGFFTRATMRALPLVAGSADLAAPAAPILICPPEVFYPLPNSDRTSPLEEIIKYRTESSVAIHHWLRRSSCKSSHHSVQLVQPPQRDDCSSRTSLLPRQLQKKVRRGPRCTPSQPRCRWTGGN